jgi:predicted restriction endonuclease
VSHARVEAHARKLYNQSFAKKTQSDEDLAESIRKILLAKSQFPAIQMLLDLMSTKKSEGKTRIEFSAAEKKIINEAYTALGAAAIPQSAFANAIHYLIIKQNVKKPTR